MNLTATLPMTSVDETIASLKARLAAHATEGPCVQRVISPDLARVRSLSPEAILKGRSYSHCPSAHKATTLAWKRLCGAKLIEEGRHEEAEKYLHAIRKVG